MPLQERKIAARVKQGKSSSIQPVAKKVIVIESSSAVEISQTTIGQQNPKNPPQLWRCASRPRPPEDARHQATETGDDIVIPRRRCYRAVSCDISPCACVLFFAFLSGFFRCDAIHCVLLWYQCLCRKKRSIQVNSTSSTVL